MKNPKLPGGERIGEEERKMETIYRSGDNIFAADLDKEAENIKKLPGVDGGQVDELLRAAKEGQAISGNNEDRSSEDTSSQELFESLKKATKERKSYETIKSHLIVRPMNYQNNAEKLFGCVYRKNGDVALVLCQLLSDKAHNIFTSRIERKELQWWEKEEDEVLDAALGNTAKIYPPCVYSKSHGDAVNFLTVPLEKEDITFLNQVILLSTFKTTNGAAALFYPGVREKMLCIIGGPFYAVFMNINDVVILEMDNPMLTYWLQTASKSSNLGDYLSNKCYLCGQEGITVVETEGPAA